MENPSGDRASDFGDAPANGEANVPKKGDGLYRSDAKVGERFGYIYIHNGKLWLQAEYVPMVLMATSSSAILAVQDGRRKRYFVRASDMIDLMPDRKEAITAFAAKIGSEI